MNEAEFRSECGLGVVVTQEEIVKAVGDLLKEKRGELLEQRYGITLHSIPLQSNSSYCIPINYIACYDHTLNLVAPYCIHMPSPSPLYSISNISTLYFSKGFKHR